MATYTALAANTGDSGGATITSGAADAKGSYTELIASTAAAYDCFLLKTQGPEFHLTAVAFDIATGGAGAEVDFVANFFCDGLRQDGSPFAFFPIPIASGSRVSMRAQSARLATKDFEVDIIGLANTPYSNIALTGTAGCDTMGFNSTDTGGVQVDPGGTANTKGSYSEIVASTSHAYHFLAMTIGAQDNITSSDAQVLIDIATGAAASETDRISNIQMTMSANTDGTVPAYFFFPVDSAVFAAGTRIAARAQSSITDATDRLFDVILYGFYGTLPSVGGGDTIVSSIVSNNYRSLGNLEGGRY